MASVVAQKRLSQCISKAFDKYYTDLMALRTIDVSQPDKKVVADVSVEQAVVKDNTPVFKVQFLSSSKELVKGDAAFKGLSPVACYYEKGLYKYTYGESTNYNEILHAKRKVNEKFKDAFIVAFVKGERIDTQQAIVLFKQNNP